MAISSRSVKRFVTFRTPTSFTELLINRVISNFDFPVNFSPRRDLSIKSRILLFPEIPYWIATTKQGEKFLRNLTGKKTLLEVSKEILGDDYEIIAKEFLTPNISLAIIS